MLFAVNNRQHIDSAVNTPSTHSKHIINWPKKQRIEDRWLRWNCGWFEVTIYSLKWCFTARKKCLKVARSSPAILPLHGAWTIPLFNGVRGLWTAEGALLLSASQMNGDLWCDANMLSLFVSNSINKQLGLNFRIFLIPEPSPINIHASYEPGPHPIRKSK